MHGYFTLSSQTFNCIKTMGENPTKVRRLTVPDLDRILGQPWKVLDDGFIRVVDYIGADAAIVQAARISYGAGTKTVHEDVGLIRYLMRHQHTTPFEMCEIKLHIRVPMDTWRQWIRHRTANVNEYSTRYSIAIDGTTITPPDKWRKQSSSAKQGSGEMLPEATGKALTDREAELQGLSRKVYEERITAGVAREQARKDLPLCTFTEAYWKIDLHNLFHFLLLRMHEHAQEEIRAYANIIGHEIVSRWCPIAWQAFKDYHLNSLSLSMIEIRVVQQLSQGDIEGALTTAKKGGWLERDSRGLKPNRERREAEIKLKTLGIKVPWVNSSI